MRVCVFCGSSPGARPEYAAAAAALGTRLAQRGMGLVYGGARVGLMGAVADAALAAGGEVIGVIPRALVEREVAHSGLADLRVVSSMHERKATMADLSDAFVALPGGIGTFEELFEVWTWGQLGLHAKPVALLDSGGYYAPLVAFLDHAVEERFIRPGHRAALLVERDIDALLDRLATWTPLPREGKWMGGELGR
ncbi:MAG TPA: TIGR00730 family Rossman fold protein [Gemmatimonadaceae bacterium]|nr:TIGR00730 family Rossman fold protein [Gemmatimonadaceae bacterium]